MFLRKLSEENKLRFFNLAKLAIESDEKIHAKEKELLEEYCAEMGITSATNNLLDGVVATINTSTRNLSELLDELNKNCTEYEKRAITFEILALLLVDEEYHAKEASFMDEVVKSFSISLSATDEMKIYINEYMDSYKKIVKFLES